MEKVLIVSGDGNLIEKLRFIFFENYGASDITSISNPESCIRLASQIKPQLIVIDTSAFDGSMQEFFDAKNSQSITRKIPIVLFDKGLKINDVPQLNAIIDASLNDQDISRSLTILNDIHLNFDTFNINEDVYGEIESYDLNEYLSENHAYMLNEVKRDVESGRYQYKIVATSPKFEKIVGMNSSKFLSEHSLEKLHGINSENKSLFENLPQDKKIVRTQQYFDSNQRYLDVLSVGIKENQIATFVKDITQKKKLEQKKVDDNQQASEFEKFKDTFIANISHEIRTPMNAILGFSRLLELETIDSTKRKQYISIIQKSGFQLIETIDKLIDLSKIQSNQFFIHNNTFELSKVISEIESYAKRKLSENDKHELISFSMAVANDIKSLTIHSDQFRLIQILKELIDNAVKFTIEGSILFYCFFSEKKYANSDSKKYIEFSIKDTGIGIEPDCLNTIFGMFSQIENIEFSKSGLGIGISISQKIVEMMEGSIWAESKLGEGSTFFVSIPVS